MNTHQSAVQDYFVKWEPTERRFRKTPLEVVNEVAEERIPMKYQIVGEGPHKLEVRPRYGGWTNTITHVIRDWASRHFPQHELVLATNDVHVGVTE